MIPTLHAGEGASMIKTMFVLVASVLSVPAWCAESATPVSQMEPTEQQVLDQFRDDLQARSADVMAKGLTLSSEQAAKFWPLFDAYQKEQNQIVEGQLKATQQFIASYQKVSEPEALAYVNALLDRDQQVHDLRVKWLAKFQTVVPPKVAARAIQLERRMGVVTQVKLSSQIPLIR
jgi:Spy/CpxP family protein refolding chaperone